jgi:hypothetical protein
MGGDDGCVRCGRVGRVNIAVAPGLPATVSLISLVSLPGTSERRWLWANWMEIDNDKNPLILT